MDPSMFQLSRIIHDERLQEAAYNRHMRENGTKSAGSINRSLHYLSKVCRTLFDEVKVQLHLAPAANTSRKAYE